MNRYRSHNCNQLRKGDIGKKINLSGWINKKRDHGNILFVDLRDNYGITQCIINKDNKNFNELEKIQGKVNNSRDTNIKRITSLKDGTDLAVKKMSNGKFMVGLNKGCR